MSYLVSTLRHWSRKKDDSFKPCFSQAPSHSIAAGFGQMALAARHGADNDATLQPTRASPNIEWPVQDRRSI